MLRRLAAVACVAGLMWTMTVPAEAAPQKLCSLSGDKLSELSGLASDEQNWYAVNDGGTQLEIVVLDKKCGVERTITAPTDPYDVEDMAIDPDGTLWLADTGDNRKQRDTVALHRVTPAGDATLYRLTYPDGQHDAEALLLAPDGTPYIVTKNVAGDSEVYRPAKKLASPGPTKLKKVTTVTIEGTSTSGGPVGSAGSVLVTGGAVSHDGKAIALRTYTDAYVYPMSGSDVEAALQSEPAQIPLPNEPQGEAIAFEPDGALLSAGEGSSQTIRSVPDAAAKAKPAEAPSNDSEADPISTVTELPTVPAVAVAVIAVALGFLGLRLLRRRW